LGLRLLIKRDDATGGVEIGGNKIRKLEFLLADALSKGCDSVVTVGGIQSNHCRATASAARIVGMEPHLILRTKAAAAATSAPPSDPSDRSSVSSSEAEVDDLGTVGNLLVDRAVGATLYTCTPGEYGRLGSEALVNRLCGYLRERRADANGQPLRKPYAIPVGGSNGLGSWGYVHGVEELVRQLREAEAELSAVDHVVFASGSGGTAAGIAIGLALASDSAPSASANVRRPQVHAVGVCDNPEYFYGQVAKIAAEMRLIVPEGQTIDDYVRKHLTVHQGKGLGYAVSTPEELAFVASFARETGVVLDPVYSGKALHHFLQLIERDPDSFKNQTILFWHTGGALGLYDKVDDETFLERLRAGSPCRRLDVYGKGIGVDISRDIR
jgi:1-aminocyclopropane-1-carboxylate deaminase/D-cysteine desulfhydrase-like pyridoxal-dependent ACC family enzyme